MKAFEIFDELRIELVAPSCVLLDLDDVTAQVAGSVKVQRRDVCNVIAAELRKVERVARCLEAALTIAVRDSLKTAAPLEREVPRVSGELASRRLA